MPENQVFGRAGGGRMSDYGIIFGIVLDDFQGDAWYGYYIL